MDDASQQSQPRSSTDRAGGFEPPNLGSTPSGASTFMVHVWLLLIFAALFAILCIAYDIRAELHEANGSLDLIREGQYMSDEEWEAYCKMFPEDCEETY